MTKSIWASTGPRAISRGDNFRCVSQSHQALTMRSAVAKQFLALFAEKSAGHGDEVIALLEDQLAGNQTSPPLVVFRAALASIRSDVFLGNPVDNRSNARPHACACAHGAWFVSGVQNEVRQVTAVPAGHIFQRLQLYVFYA